MVGRKLQHRNNEANVPAASQIDLEQLRKEIDELLGPVIGDLHVRLVRLVQRLRAETRRTTREENLAVAAEVQLLSTLAHQWFQQNPAPSRLQDLIARHIDLTLVANRGQVSMTAKQLGVSRRMLQRWRKKGEKSKKPAIEPIS